MARRNGHASPLTLLSRPAIIPHPYGRNDPERTALPSSASPPSQGRAAGRGSLGLGNLRADSESNKPSFPGGLFVSRNRQVAEVGLRASKGARHDRSAG